MLTTNLTTDLISVVVTTYNRSDALIPVIQGLLSQDDANFEVIITDDGSTSEHQQKIINYLNRLKQFQESYENTANEHLAITSISYTWHPDEGFTVSKARNHGVCAAQGNYIIFLDGDCIPEMDFVSQHRRLREINFFINGSRVLLSPKFSNIVIQNNVKIFGQSVLYWVKNRLQKNANKIIPLLRWPKNWLRQQPRFYWSGIRSCNMGVWRTDFEAVNGFDETFTGWGHEDADFVLRLHNYGLMRKNGFFATEVYHLWHKESNRLSESINTQRVLDRIKTGQKRSTSGYQESRHDTNVVVKKWSS